MIIIVLIIFLIVISATDILKDFQSSEVIEGWKEISGVPQLEKQFTFTS